MNQIKALWINGEKPYRDYIEILQVGRALAKQITRTDDVKILNVLPCLDPHGFAVVFSYGGIAENGGNSQDKKNE